VLKSIRKEARTSTITLRFRRIFLWPHLTVFRGPLVARPLGQHHPVFPVPAGDPQGDLHHQRDRVVEHGDAKVHTQPAHLSQRRVSAEVAVPDDPGSVKELEIDPSLEAGIAELPVDVRRGVRATGSAMTKTQLHSWFDTPAELSKYKVIHKSHAR